MRKYLVLLIMLVITAAAGWANPAAPPYPAAYWINGQLTGGNGDLSGFTTYFYSNQQSNQQGPWSAYALGGVTAVNGKFLINALDDLRQLPLSAKDYYLRAEGPNGQRATATLPLSAANLLQGQVEVEVNLPLTPIDDTEFRITTTSPLPRGSKDYSYSCQLLAVNGTPSYRWEVIDGSGELPPGLALSPNGLIGGTPTTLGVYQFFIRATDAAGKTDFRFFELTVGSEPPQTGNLTVIVTDQNSQPLNNARVVVVRADTLQLIADQRTGAAGNSLTLTLWPGAYQVIASADRHRSGQILATVEVGRGTVVEAKLTPLLSNQAAINGLVTNEAGTLLANATITAKGSNSTTNQFGWYEIILELESEVNVNVTAALFGYQAASKTTTLRPQEQRQVDFLLLAATLRGELQVQVVRQSDGGAIPAATVNLEDDQGVKIATKTTDQDGWITAPNLAIGKYFALAAYRGYRPNYATAMVKPNETTKVVIALESEAGGWANIFGLVRDNQGSELSGARIAAGAFSTASNGDGYYDLRVYAPNLTTYYVRASLAGYREDSRTVKIEDGEALLNDFTLSLIGGSGTFTGQVTDNGTAAPIFGARVSDGTRGVTTNSQGIFTIPQVPPGTYRLTALADSYEPAESVEQTMSINATVTVNFALVSVPNGKGTVTGTVWDDQGNNLADVRVELVNKGKQENTDARGSYQFTNLDPDNYVVQASRTGYLTQQKAVTLAANSTRVADFVLSRIPLLQILTENLPTAEAGKSYSATLQALGGVEPYTWIIDSGSLPEGLTLETISGLIAGTPPQIEAAGFTAKVTDQNRQFATKYLDLLVMPPWGDGPIVNINVLLQGRYDPVTKTQRPATILFEARSSTATSEITANALVGSCEMIALYDGWATNRGTWQTKPSDGNYYLVVKQKHPKVAAGPSHIPIIVSGKRSLSTVTPLTLNLSRGEVYEEVGRFPAQYTIPDSGGRKAMWSGDMNGDTYVNVIDVGSAWYYLYKKFNARIPEANLGPQYPSYKIADLDGNSLVNVIDVGGPWYTAFMNLKRYNGPHTYAAPLQ